MAYDPNIPQASDFISNSQLAILTNFQDLNTIFGEDHVTWNAASRNGRHEAVRLQEQAADPTTQSAEGSVYTKLTSGNDELYYRYQSNGTVMQLTSGGGLAQGLVMFAAGITSSLGVGPATFTSSFNFNAAITLGLNSATFTFASAAPSTNYVVLCLPGGTVDRIWCASLVSRTVNNFTLAFSQNNYTTGTPSLTKNNPDVTMIGVFLFS